MGLCTTVWTIENLLFWDVALHGNVIENPHSSQPDSTKMHLYPKGISGREDCMIIHVFTDRVYQDRSATWGTLTLCNSHGKLVFMQQFEVGPEPRQFELGSLGEVVLGSWENESAEQEILRLDCAINTCWSFNQTHCLRTAVEVFDVEMKIPNKIMRECKFEYPVRTLVMEYPRDELTKDGVAVFLSMDPNSRLHFEVQQACFKEKCWAYVYLTVVIEKHFVQKEQIGHLFEDGKKWSFWSTFLKEQLQSAGVELIVRVKIVPSNKLQHNSYFSGLCRRRATVHVFPTACYNSRKFTESFNPVSLNQPGPSVDMLTKDFTKLYRDKEFSDFYLRCDDVVFPVHKAILSSRSPVFKDMLRDGHCPSTHDADFDPLTMDLFLTLLYSGVAPARLEFERALKLYRAADKYQVASIRAMCVSVLGTEVCVDNFSDILLLAHTHKDERLTEIVLKFFCRNWTAVVSSDRWKMFSRNYPQLVESLKAYPENL